MDVVAGLVAVAVLVSVVVLLLGAGLAAWRTRRPRTRRLPDTGGPTVD